MPSATLAGGTEAVNRATAQMARLRMRWLVPKGGDQSRSPSLRGRCTPSLSQSPLSRSGLTSALEVAFRLELGQGRVERLTQAAEQVGELGLVDDQRRADRDAVAHVANEQPARHGVVVDAVAGADLDEVEGRLGLLVGDDLQRAHHADAHRLADQRMIGKRL